jgi:hypothetical protein
MKIEVTIPDGKKGDWSVETFIITKKDADFENIRGMFSSGPSPYYIPGTYKRLMKKGKVIMSNTPDEIGDHLHFIYEAKGDVLINGLGLGVCLKAILAKPEVRSVVVIEKEQDVIDLVGVHFDDPRLKIICADALEYKPPPNTKYDYVWHDIWDCICLDNLEMMGTLHRKYGRRARWQDSWKRDWLKYEQRRERERSFIWC